MSDAQYGRTAFSALTSKTAERLATGMRALKVLGAPGLVLEGAWNRRRFVIETLRRPPSFVSEITFDTDALTLTFPIDAEPARIVQFSRSFGAKIERAFRDRNSTAFEWISGSDGGPLHFVLRHHHVALCGARGPWPREAASEALIVDHERCFRCREISMTKPPLLARYHPLARRR